MMLLSHITFYDHHARRADPDPPYIARERRVAVNKTSTWWRERVFRGVQAQLREMACCYPAEFRAIDVVVDVNHENGYVARLVGWAARELLASRVRLRVRRAPRRLKPFLLAWVHRAAMRDELASDKYAWAMYSEDDTFVPALALRAQLDFAAAAAAQRALLAFVRVVNDTRGAQFLADARRSIRDPSASPLALRPRPAWAARHWPSGNQTQAFTALRSCPYSAAWAYPRETITRGFMQSADWKGTAAGSSREDAAWGWHTLLHGQAGYERCVSAPALFVQHLGSSMDAYFKHPAGFNTLPARRALAPHTGLAMRIAIVAGMVIGMAIACLIGRQVGMVIEIGVGTGRWAIF